MSAPVDVLAVLGRRANELTRKYGADNDLAAVRAVVADLIADVTPLIASLQSHITQDDAMTQQAIMVRRAAAAIAKATGVQSMSSRGNEPAYPWGEHGTALGGLTKRELFAAMAMQGLAAVPLQGSLPSEAVKSDAQRAVEYADALIAQLEDNE